MSASDEYYPIALSKAATEEPLLAVIARLVAAKGVDPDTTALAEFFQDDGALWFGLLATRDGRVYQIDYDHLHSSSADGALAEWRDLTGSWTASHYREQIAAALKFAQTAA